MKFVALVSGGKDSCYNIAKCVSHGHELVCLANLCPPREFEGEDMDSFMYQTAASNVLSAFSACLGVPMVQAPIKGRPVVQQLRYEAAENDEVEDMVLLLQEVKRRFPEVTAVSCGAILSNYQRFRVEDVCSRMGLIPLHYLWQRDRRSLLTEMVSQGIHAVLVKVSGGGLDPLKHLGKDLATMMPTFERLHERFGLDICGEGGEYETMVLDMPMFKQRIEITDSEPVCDESDPSVGHLRIKSFRLVAKGDGVCDDNTAVNIWVDDLSHNVLYGGMTHPLKILAKLTVPVEHTTVPPSVDGLGCTNIFMPAISTRAEAQAEHDTSIEGIIDMQVKSLMSQLSEVLHNYGGGLADACFIHLYVADMSNFGAVNAAYSKYFGKNPPSRSCIAALLPPGVQVALQATYLIGSYAAMGLGRSARREVLHVRSQSEWAPMCIGPYSQANCLASSIVLVAGQIALMPETMNVLGEDVASKATPKDIITRLLDNSHVPHFGSRFCDGYATTRGKEVQFQSDISEIRDSYEYLTSKIICELLLSIRNAFQVAACLNSSSEFTISCIVFLNMSSIPPSIDPSKITIYLRLLSKYVLVNQPEYQWSKIAELIGVEASKITELEDGDNEDNESDDELRVVTGSPPVVVVPVPSLPRNASVEVEIITTATSIKAQNVTFSEYEWDSSRIAECLNLMASSVKSRERSLPCWPLFQAARGSSKPSQHVVGVHDIAQNPTGNVAQTAHSFTRIFTKEELIAKGSLLESFAESLNSLKVQVDCATVSKCICSGYSSVIIDPSSSNMTNALQAIVFSIADALQKASLQWSNICYLTIFASSDVVALSSTQSIDQEVFACINSIFGEMATVHLITVPPIHNAPNLMASFVALDLLQIKTELWIRGD